MSIGKQGRQIPLQGREVNSWLESRGAVLVRTSGTHRTYRLGGKSIPSLSDGHTIDRNFINRLAEALGETPDSVLQALGLRRQRHGKISKGVVATEAPGTVTRKSLLGATDRAIAELMALRQTIANGMRSPDYYQRVHEQVSPAFRTISQTNSNGIRDDLG